MATGFPVKANYATGDVLTAANMNDLAGTLNYLDPTAKGDLFPASDGSTLTRLAVGADNTLLVADSTQTTGIKWAGGWQDWTPTLGFTIGNGTTVARYQQVGKTVYGYLKITWGTTSAFSGQLSFTLPATPKNYPLSFLGQANDAGVANYGWIGVCFSGNTVYGYGATTSTSYLNYGTLDSGAPFTWGNGDILFIQFSYEVA